MTARCSGSCTVSVLRAERTSRKGSGDLFIQNSVARMPLLVHTNRKQKLFEERLLAFPCS